MTALPLGEAPMALPTAFSAPVTLEDLAGLDQRLVAALSTLDELLFVGADAVSADPWMPVEAQRVELDRHGVELRALLQLSRSKVDALRALVRLAAARRRTAPRALRHLRKAGAR